MAVKVVKVEPAPEVVKQVVCKKCGVTLEFVPRDVKSRNGTDIGGGPDGCEWINCPNCRNKVVLRTW